MTTTATDPHDELVAIVKRADDLVPALAARLAPLVAPLRDPRVVRAFVVAELNRLLGELAAGASEPARRALLGLELPLPDTRSTRKGGRA